MQSRPRFESKVNYEHHSNYGLNVNGVAQIMYWTRRATHSDNVFRAKLYSTKSDHADRENVKSILGREEAGRAPHCRAIGYDKLPFPLPISSHATPIRIAIR